MGKRKSGVVGGLALHTDSLRYIELKRSGSGSGSFDVVRQEFLPLSPNCITREAIQQLPLLGNSFEELRNTLRGISCPVVIGIPARDVMMRTINYPRMSLDDVRGALEIGFDGYFPYSWNEAAADIAEVEIPTMGPDMTVLVATARRAYINDLLRTASRAGLKIAAAEPMNVAFFRAIGGATGKLRTPQAWFAVGVESDVTNIMLGWHDNGILYRTTLANITSVKAPSESLVPIVQDVQNTMVFAGNQYRGLQIQQLILGGSFGQNSQLKMMLETSTQLSVTYSDVWTGWHVQNNLDSIPGFETAIGLALHQFLPASVGVER